METLALIGISNAIQAALLAGLVLVLTRWLRHAAVSRCLWMLVLAKLITPPIIDLQFLTLSDPWHAGGREFAPSSAHVVFLPDAGVEDAHTQAIRPQEAAGSQEPSSQQTDSGSVRPEERASAVGSSAPDNRRWIESVLTVVGWGWLIGALVSFVVVAFRARRLSILVRRLRRAPQHLQDSTRELATRIGLRSAPDVLLVDAEMSPFLWGSGQRAVIVLPTPLINLLDESQQKVVLAHELAHLARHGWLIRWLDIVAGGLYWWHPAVWLALRELRQAEELCCDSTAISQFSLETKEYARTLLRAACFLADRGLPLPQTVCGFGETATLKRRIRMITLSEVRHRLSPPLRMCLLLVAGLILSLSPVIVADDGNSPPNISYRDGAPPSVGAAATEAGAELQSVSRSVDAIAPEDESDVDDEQPPAQFENSGELLHNNGFEETETIRVGVPSGVGYWGGDESSIVGSEQGIIPHSGEQMLRLLASGPVGPGQGYTACEVFQLIDLAGYRDVIDAGQAMLSTSIMVNRVHHSNETDTAFALTVYACEGETGEFHRAFLTDQTMAEVGSSIHTDKNAETWENIQLNFRIPRGATYVGLRVTTGENVSDDATNEFHGHYVDAASVRISRRASSVPILPPSTTRTFPDFFEIE